LASTALAPTERRDGLWGRYCEPKIATLGQRRRVRSLIAWAGALLLVFLSTMAQAAKPDADKLRSVLSLENAWNQAESRHDGDALKLLLADDFAYTDYDGSFMNRDQWLKKVEGGEKNYRALANVVQNARSYGDTVVVTGIYVEKLTIKGKEVDRNSGFTDTWIFQNGHWECVASQSTLVSP
jgi:hypothetical protein